MHIRLLTLGAIFIISLLLIQRFNCDDNVNIQQKNVIIVVPSAPLNLTVHSVTATEISLSWAKPTGYLYPYIPHIHEAHPHTAASTSIDHQNKQELLNLKSGDILANRDSALVDVLKDTSRHHGAYVSRLIKSSEQYQPEYKYLRRDRSYASEDSGGVLFTSQWKNDNVDKFLRRLKKRRDVSQTDAAIPTTTVPTTLPPIVEKKNEAMIQLDDPDSSAKKSIEQEAYAKVENMLINYVLFYEEGLGGNNKNNFSNTQQRTAKIKELVLTFQHGKDRGKGATYKLQGLKPYTYYRIWVHAYFTEPDAHKAVPHSSQLSAPTPAVIVLTDIGPPSPPIMRALACDKTPGTMRLTWARPETFAGTLKSYEVILKKEGVFYTRVPIDTEEEHIETSVTLPVDIKGNVTVYQVSLKAYSKSIVNPDLLINGTESDEYEITMTSDCGGLIDQVMTSDSEDSTVVGSAASGSEVGYLVIIIALGAAILLVLVFIYRVWGCSNAFKKCFPMSYLFLEEGGNGDGCGENGLSSKSDSINNQTKKAVSPAHAVVFWGNSENNPGTEPLITEQLWDPQHPPVPSGMFLTHTAALHQDGDIGFSKEYELIQARSALLGHTSHHSQHPDNRHKNRYLNITAYDHSRVCLLPNAGCACDPGKEHRRSCDTRASPPSGDSSPHFDYVNANFIDGIISDIDAELAKFIIEENEKRRIAQKKKEEVEAVKSEIEAKMAETEKMTQSQLPADLKLKLEHSTLEAKNPSGYNTMDPRISLGPFKDKLSLELDRKVTSPVLEIYPNTCRLSINLDKKEAEKVETEVKNEKEKAVKETKSKKRSTSADTRDIIIDKKASSRGHSKNPSVVVNSDSPSNGLQKIEGAFLNIEFSGIVDSERELQKAREAERLEEANRLAKEATDETLDDLDDLYVHIGGEAYRIKSSWLLDRRRYIGTQGPTPGTLRAFWKMVWDHRVAILVMITNLIERGRRKCDQYWPKEGNETYGVIQVQMLKEDVMATYTVRTFLIKNIKVGVSRTVMQYHYTVWPDHGTPEHPLAVLRFREAARKAAQSGAILVHCSAGVGRTGTYIVLDAMLNHLKLTGCLNVFGFLCHIRTQRNFLVQTEEQYVFIHDALLEAIQSGDTEVLAENAKDYLKKLLEPFPEGHVVDGGTLNSKCGVYGLPLAEEKKPELPNLLQHVRLRNESTGEGDFAMWDVDTVQRIKDESRNKELMSMLANDGVNNGRHNSEEKRNSFENERNRRSNTNSLREQNGTTKFITLEIEDSGKNNMDISPELVNDDKQIINFDDGVIDNLMSKTGIVNKSADIKAETGSLNSLNAKSDHSNNSYEKLNGTCTKTSEESKASSMSNEEVELLPNENNDIKMNGNNSKMDECNPNGDHSNTVSSISSDTNNINGNNFRDRPNYSPRLESQDSVDGYRREKNKIRNDDNYELMSTNPRLVGAMMNNGSTVNSIMTVAGSGGSESFDGKPRYACQKRNTSNKKARNLLEHQFKLITSFEPSKYHMNSASKMVNQAKNRRGAVWPVESSRVPLTPKPGEEGSDYINATWLQGHRFLKEYVITQHPLHNTVEDLYRLLWDHTCQLLVVLTDTDDPECQQFWPTADNEEFNVYNYNIRFVSQERYIAKRRPLNPDFRTMHSSPKSLSPSEERRPTTLPIPSPSSSSINRAPSSRGSQKSSPTSPDSEAQGINQNQDSPNSCLMRSNSNLDENQDGNFYQQQSGDNQDEERLIPKSEETPSLECDETRRLNSDPKNEDYAFDKSELRIETAAMMDENVVELRERLSPNKIVANGDPFSPKDDKKSQTKSPSKISFKNFRISSPVLRSPTKFKFDFGARMSLNAKMPESNDQMQGQDKTDSPVPSVNIPETPAFEPKFEMVPFKSPCQLRDGNEEIGKDCIITTTHLSMNSLQDDYELKVRLIECPKWLADLDYDENSDTDECSEDDEYEMEAKALDYVIEQRLKAYKGVFGLPEYITRCQDEYTVSPVVVIDKFGGARATALCTLSSALRQSARDVYSLSKLHHGRRPGSWRRPADIRAMYEALAAYQQV